MDHRDALQAEIERTRDALADKAHLLEERVVESVVEAKERVVEAKERVVDVLDVRSQYRSQPWRFVLTALAAGVLTACWSARSGVRHALRLKQGVELLSRQHA